VELIHLAQDSDKLRAVVNTEMNNVFQKMSRISSLTEKIVSSQEELCSVEFATTAGSASNRTNFFCTILRQHRRFRTVQTIV